MESILRVAGTNLNLSEVAEIMSVKPYRTETRGSGRARMNCLFFDVAKGERQSFAAMIDLVDSWLRDHKELETLRTRSDVDRLEIDIGVGLDEEVVSSSFELDPRFLELAARLGMSILISIYRTTSNEKRSHS